MKPTAGTWLVVKNPEPIAHPYSVVSFDEELKNIADISIKICEGEALANGNLLAASKDMLKLCEDYLDLAEILVARQFNLSSKIKIEEITQVIAKAKGAQ